MTHAPTPYRQQPYVDGIDLVDAEGLPVAHIADRKIEEDGSPPANAAFICRACNSHDELLEIAKAIVWTDENSPAGYRFRPEFVSTVRAALSRATGESQ